MQHASLMFLFSYNTWDIYAAAFGNWSRCNPQRLVKEVAETPQASISKHNITVFSLLVE
jgi:hypothetical protein